MAFVNSYCSNNPLSTVAAAGLALVKSLGGEKTGFPWKR